MPSRPLLLLGSVFVLTAIVVAPDLQAQRGRSRTLERMKLVERFDADENGRLDTKERAAARKWVLENPPRWRRLGGGRGEQDGAAGATGQEVILPMQVPHYPKRKLYDRGVLRTMFLCFPQEDWSRELADFFLTDVDVPATMFVDGKRYTDVGVRYRGSSSYLFVAANKKKPINISIDFVHDKQRLRGNRTLNLTNASQDASMVREVVFADIAGRYVPAARANYVKLVVNGEDRGVYVNVQQFNRDFLGDWFPSRKGVRWKILRNYGGAGALTYLGDDPARYRKAYELKTTGSASGGDEAWKRLIRFTKLLQETPDDDKQAVLPKVLDIDRTCWFLALEWVFKDSDGYVRQGYDYRLFEDEHGRFVPILYDNNEILPAPSRGGFGGFAARRVRGQRPIGNDPLEQLDNIERPLISELLAVPAWRARYLAHVRTLTTRWLDWQHLGPLCRRYHDVIKKDVEKDRRKLYSYERFEDGLEELQDLAEARRQDVLAHPALEGPWPEITFVSHQPVADKAGRRLRVTARLGNKVPVDKVILYVRKKRRVGFRPVRMYDDGKHDDGAAGDRVFCGDTMAFTAGTKIRYYVEARAPKSVGTTTFQPQEAEAGAIRYRFDR